jgi:hypothetical protein
MFIDPRRRRRIVPIVAPGRMGEVDDEVTVIGCDCVIKNQSPNALPICKAAPL